MKRDTTTAIAVFLLILIVLILIPFMAYADGVSSLKNFVATIQTGKADFVQTIISPNGKTRVSNGTFEFSRPNKFKFIYIRPAAISMIADGRKIYVYDIDLNQVTVRDLGAVLGSTPAVILSGGNIERQFTLQEHEPQDGLEWVLAVPKSRDGAVEAMRVGFRNRELAVLEIMDSFGQKSVIVFSNLQTNVPLSLEGFNFKAPPGAEVFSQ